MQTMRLVMEAGFGMAGMAGMAGMGLKEAVLMAEVSVPMVVLIVEAVVLMVTGTGCGRGYA